MPQMSTKTIATVGVAVAAIGIGVGALLYARGDDLQRSDPAGAKACQELRNWISGDLIDPETGKSYNKLVAAAAIAETAKGATTPEIRAAVGPDVMDDPVMDPVKANGGPQSLHIADLRKLHAACVSVGADMPSYVEPSS